LSTLKESKPTLKATLQVIKTVAARLGNTPAVCRKCYIHPAVFEGYLAGTLKVTVTGDDLAEFPGDMWELERQLVRFLKNFMRTKSASHIKRI
jgi:DNA topoisomerase I